MSDFTKLMTETKGQLKGLLGKDSSQELIKIVSAIDKNLDNLNDAYTEKTKENESLKNDLIESIKATGFKVNGSTDDSGATEETKSIDQIMEEELAKITAKQGGN